MKRSAGGRRAPEMGISAAAAACYRRGVRSVSTHCLQCGAPLSLASLRQQSVRCEHCGSVIRPETAEGGESAQLPEPATPAPDVYTASASSHARRWWYGIVPALICYGAYWAFGSQSQSPTLPPPVREARVVPLSTPSPGVVPSPTPSPRVLPGLLLVPSLGGNAGDDLVALIEGRPDGQRALGAIDGETGTVLWQRPLGPEPALGEGARAWIDDMLVVASPAKLFALNAGTGETSWVRATDAPPIDLCAGQGYAGLLFPDRRFAAFSVTTGSSVSRSVDACAEVPTSRSVAPNFSFVEGDRLDPPLPARPPFLVQRALVPHKGSVRVLLGSDASQAARVAVASRKDWLWDARLGRDHAHQARLLSPPLAAVRNQRIVVPYQVSTTPPELHLASLDIASGRLEWDHVLSTRSIDAPDARAELRMARAGTSYFSNGLGQLWAVRADARPAWTSGEK